MSTEVALEVRDLSKCYEVAFERLNIFTDVSFQAATGEFVAVMGPSGSGKSTLISLLGGLDREYSGSIQVAGIELEALSARDCVSIRSSILGLVFQDYRLLPQLTALENVEAPLYLHRMDGKERRSRARDALRLMRLEERGNHKPSQLSGGERQRVAIARAVVGGAQILLCDEPTGNLNREMSDSIFLLLQDLCRHFSKTIILTTHDHNVIRFTDRVLTIEHQGIRCSSPGLAA